MEAASNRPLSESILFFGSDKVFDSSSQHQQPQHATTNALLLKFDHLAKDNEVRTGDPTYCSQCNAVLNTYSLIKRDDKEGQQQWTCEFCGQVNDIELDEEEIPKKEPQDFVSGTIIEEEKKDDKTLAAEDESNVIFCIDTSGSMSMTTSVKGGHRYKDLGSKSLFKSASSKKEEDEEVWVSRLEFVQSAVDAQLEAMKRDTPKRKVGIITFSAQVVVYDDIGKAHEIKGPALDDYSGLLEKGSSFSLERPISQTRDELGRTVRGLEDGGATALGPALLIAISIASQKPGSKVIICTDGLANVGVGSLEGETGGDFYEQVAQYARRKGVVLSVISIKGADTRLEKLGALADITRGTVDLVDPDNLDFSNLVSAASLATNCVVTLYLHPALQFVNEENEEEKKGGVEEKNLNYTKLIKDVGNASTDTQVCFEFAQKSINDKKIMGDKIPFQIQIAYTKLNGMECKRVLTIMKEVTKDRQEAQKNLDICVISANLAQQSARMARAGNYEEALQNARRVKALIETQLQTEEQKKLFEIFMKEFREISNALESAMAAEADVGGGFATSSFSRTENRSDYVAHKLYSHKAAKAEACLVM